MTMLDPERQAVFRPMIQADLAPAMYVGKYAMEGLSRSEGREPSTWNRPSAGS